MSNISNYTHRDSRLLFFLQALVLILAGLAPFLAEAKIIETHSFKEILQFIDNDTWLLVDIDNTLFESTQALGHANWFYDELQQRIQKGMTREEGIADFYPTWIKAQETCVVKPIEQELIPTLIALQNENIVVMGLTHRQTSIVHSTLRQVNSLDFDFSKTAPSTDSFPLPAKSPTLYLNGILFVGDYNKKSDIFLSFLSKINKFPTKIVFIDDQRKNVEELEEALIQQDIEYIGVYYTAIDYENPVYVPSIEKTQKKGKP